MTWKEDARDRNRGYGGYSSYRAPEKTYSEDQYQRVCADLRNAQSHLQDEKSTRLRIRTELVDAKARITDLEADNKRLKAALDKILQLEERLEASNKTSNKM